MGVVSVHPCRSVEVTELPNSHNLSEKQQGQPRSAKRRLPTRQRPWRSTPPRINLGLTRPLAETPATQREEEVQTASTTTAHYRGTPTNKRCTSHCCTP